MSYSLALGIQLGSSQTSLTLECQPKKSDLTNTGAVLTTLFTELSGGLYTAYLTVPDDTVVVVIQNASGHAALAVYGVSPADRLVVAAGGAITGSLSGAVGSVTGSVGSVTAPVTAGAISDKTGYALTAGEHTAIATDAQTGLTAQGYTPTRAGYLDTLNGLVAAATAAVWAAATRTLSAFGFTPVAASVTAPVTTTDTANVTAIKAKTDLLPSDPASNTEVDTRLATTGYTTPPTTGAIDTALTTSHGAGTWQQGNTVAPATPANVAAVAAAILLDPTHLLLTDASGYVTAARVEGDVAGDVEGDVQGDVLGMAGSTAGTDALMAYLVAHLTTPTLVVVSSVNAGGVLSINRGDDYSADDNRALTITFTTGDDLSGPDTQWILDIGGGVLSVLSGVGTNTSGQTWAAVFHPTAAQTALLKQLTYVFTLTVRRGDPPTTLTEVYGTVAVRPAGYTATALDT